jgi:arylsulfatase A-like enzyme
MPPEPYASLYPAASIPPWRSFGEDLAAKPVAQQRLLAQRGVVGWSWEDWQPAVARCFGFVSFIDAEIGRIRDAFQRVVLRDRTVVIHTDDHGDLTGSHGGLFNKGPVM